jgi:glycosyltransferase involved in cell wall biosynthesis
MKIAFDAKRAFKNSTGLGHYSRTLISSLAEFYPENEYLLFTPAKTNLFNTAGKANIKVLEPVAAFHKLLKSLWRSNLVTSDLKKQGVDLYHGLSHEIPVGIAKTGIKSVVTIHDLIFERYPAHYGIINKLIHRKKIRYACTHADAVIAISEQTKQDLLEFYKVPAEKIRVCYQSCDAIFSVKKSEEEKAAIKAKYNLPDEFYLSVGSVTERKNLLTVCKALNRLKDVQQIPLVVIGGGKKYKEEVKKYLKENGIEHLVIFLSENPASSSPEYKSSADFPAIYQSAIALIYPSVFEGFGIPILEALVSGLPTIISNVSCMPETGGDTALYIDPFDDDALAEKMQLVKDDHALAQQMIEKGFAHAQKFTVQKCAAEVMKIYNNIFQ